MQEQEEEKKGIPIPQIMLILLQQLNYTAHEKEAVLQCEESGSKVANLQGFLAGVRAYKKALRDNGYTFDIKFDSTEERNRRNHDPTAHSIRRGRKGSRRKPAV